MADWVISTNTARCRDCYRCVRACPVKAVRIRNGQAEVVPELCIACGTCVIECPQDAKVVRDGREAIRAAIAAGRMVIASVAPSVPAFFDVTLFSQVGDVLERLGFKAVHETAFGAEMIGLAHKDTVDREPERWPVITSSCPVVVNLIEKYHPTLIPHLAPLVSPLVAHGRWLRERYGEDAYIAFVGPCIAKKEEIREGPVAGAIDAAVTYAELAEWMAQEGVDLPPCPDVPERISRANARLFPVEGGLVGTANMDTDILTSRIITTSGLDACQDVLDGIERGELSACMVELMACEGGCINGPAMGTDESIYLARQRVIDYATRRQPEPLPTRDMWPRLDRTYENKHTPVPAFSEAQITEVLHRVDKYEPEDELNCGACGYPTCREKAAATLRGMAEATMCIPYMRRRAESLRQVVMDVTPDAILVVDTRLYVQDLSPSAERMLNVHLRAVQGKPLHTIMPVVDGFSRVRNTGELIAGETVRLHKGLCVEQTIVPVEGQNLLVGILHDVTERESQRQALETIRTETLARTQQVVQKQMRVAHEIAQLLGETTAESKTMLSRLAHLLEEESGS